MAPPLKNHEKLSRATMLSFKKRKECIFKKTRELSVLCDIKACTVIVDADGKIESWPQSSSHVQDILEFKKDPRESCDQQNPMLQQKDDSNGKDSPEDILKLVEEKLGLVNRKIEWLRSLPLESAAPQTLCDFDLDLDFDFDFDSDFAIANSSTQWSHSQPCNTNDWDQCPSFIF